MDIGDILGSLNPEQRKAVTHRDGSLLILAGAGTGKTRVLTARIAWLISEKLARPQEILAVTFTNKAANEMKGRIAELCGESIGGMWSGTFHGICHKMLRIHHEQAGLPRDFLIVDSSDQRTILRRMLRDCGDGRFELDAVCKFVQRFKGRGILPGDIRPETPDEKLMLPIYELYERSLEDSGKVDFDGLLIKSCAVLSEDDVRERWTARFRHIMVDEFQDTNGVQYRWLDLLRGDGRSFFAVGDDDQSIYKFRGAQIGNLVKFHKHFGDVGIVRLETNYRSSSNIIKASNQLIAKNTMRMGKTLRPAGDAGELIELYAANGEEDEAIHVTQTVTRLSKAGLSLDDIAVLYRANRQSRVIEQQLNSHGIKNRLRRERRFLDRIEIRAVIAYLQLAANPQNDDAFRRVVNMPPRGIGPKGMEQIEQCAAEGKIPLVQAAARIGGRTAAFAQFAETLAETVEQKQQLADVLAEMVCDIIKQSGLLEYYRGRPDGVDRIENLDEFANMVAQFKNEDADDVTTPLQAFLATLALMTGDENSEDDEAAAVTLSTVHGAKGLEFGAVIIIGLEAGNFPRFSSSSFTVDEEEERRLMYVAMTRAKHRLFLSYARTRMIQGSYLPQKRSPFISDIPTGLLNQKSSPIRSSRTTRNGNWQKTRTWKRS